MLVTLCDTGPIVAIIDGDDRHHSDCLATLALLPAAPLRTTWPCLIEAMYLLGRAAGFAAQDELWGYLEDGLMIPHQADADECRRMRVLMRRYRDTPMDMADASLVAAAERLEIRRIFTLDRHFYAYRIDDQHSFQIMP